MTSMPPSTSSSLRQGLTHVTDTRRCLTPCLNPTEVTRTRDSYTSAVPDRVRSSSSRECSVLPPALRLSRAAVYAATELSARCSQDPSDHPTILFPSRPARRTGRNSIIRLTKNRLSFPSCLLH